MPDVPRRVPAFSVTLRDCRVDTFRCGGKGGQNVNKIESGVRIIHLDSGAVGQSCDERTQLQNKRIAFRRMTETPAFQAFIRVASGRELAEAAEIERRARRQVERDMLEENLRWEYGMVSD